MFSVDLKASDLLVSLDEFRLKALAWADQHPHVAYYNPNNIPYPHEGFMHLLAVSSGPALPLDTEDAFWSLREQLQQEHPLLCGFLTYDLKNQVEKLHSHNPDHIGFPLLHFFAPHISIYFQKSGLTIYSSADDTKDIVTTILLTLPHCSPG